MNVQTILFQDSQDPTRFLRIVEEKQNTVVAKVFFGPSKTNLIYHGNVELAKKLFYPGGEDTRIGFRVARDPEPVKVRPTYDRRRDHDDYDDN